jgi:hypothetical protein
MPLGGWIQICLNFWDISTRSWDTYERDYFFLTVRAVPRTLFETMQLFSISLTIKFDPDEIETFCFLLLKAEIHAILDQKL